MATVGTSFQKIEFNPDNPSAIVGELPTNGVVTIELWVGSGDVTSEVVSTVCAEIDNTAHYSWSVGNISTLDASQKQYHWRMTDSVSSETDEGDFVLFQREARDGLMPSLNDQSSYIIQNGP